MEAGPGCSASMTPRGDAGTSTPRSRWTWTPTARSTCSPGAPLRRSPRGCERIHQGRPEGLTNAAQMHAELQSAAPCAPCSVTCEPLRPPATTPRLAPAPQPRRVMNTGYHAQRGARQHPYPRPGAAGGAPARRHVRGHDARTPAASAVTTLSHRRANPALQPRRRRRPGQPTNTSGLTRVAAHASRRRNLE